MGLLFRVVIRPKGVAESVRINSVLNWVSRAQWRVHGAQLGGSVEFSRGEIWISVALLGLTVPAQEWTLGQQFSVGQTLAQRGSAGSAEKDLGYARLSGGQ